MTADLKEHAAEAVVVAVDYCSVAAAAAVVVAAAVIGPFLTTVKENVRK